MALKSICLWFILLSTNLWSTTPFQLKINCKKNINCQTYQQKFLEEIYSFKKISQLEKYFERVILLGEISQFEYFAEINNEGAISNLELNFSLKSKIEEIEIVAAEELDRDKLKSYLAFKEGDYLESVSLEESVNNVKKFLIEEGYHNPKVSIDLQILELGGYKAKITFEVTETSLVKILEIVSENKEVRDTGHKLLKNLLNKRFDRILFRELTANFESRVQEMGYYYAQFVTEVERISEKSKDYSIVLTVQPGSKLNFGFYGLKRTTRNELLAYIKEKLKKQANEPDEKSLSNLIQEYYESIGLHGTEVKSYFVVTTENQQALKNYFFDIVEGEKIFVEELSFVGFNHFTEETIKEIFYANASVLSGRNYFDEQYLNNFSSVLKTEYFKQGYIFAKVSDPYIQFENLKKGDNLAKVEYRISEGVQSILSKITFTGLPEDLEQKIKLSFANQEGQPINIVELDNDLKKGLSFLRDEGFLFSQLSFQSNPENVIQYSGDYKTCQLIIKFDLGVQAILHETILVGNLVTKNETITRDVKLKKGDIVTPEQIDEITNSLNSLGLFSSVEIKTLKRDNAIDGNTVDLMIKVKERDFGVFEVAPGYRSDIGLKLSTGISYNNISGKNRLGSISGQINRRLDLNTLEPERREASGQLLEYIGKVRYVEPYLFKMPLSFDTSASLSRKRFYTFDADIDRVSASLGKTFWKRFSTSLTYQFETIEQFNASDLKDNDSFQIGSLTPAIAFDYRDNAILPKKGMYISLSSEFSNPWFASQKNSDLDINFMKLINRNSFYLPASFGTFAIAIAWGYQKNFATDPKIIEGEQILNSDDTFATKGRIPSIKVFRLSGIDSVRGFDESEINRLETGLDINELFIQNEVFFTSFKFEPRFHLNDSVMIAPFFDAGRIEVNSWKPLSLRPAAGMSFKFLTPVGSLDFDYGLKLRRNRLPDGRLERPGKFQVSIGFF